VETDKNMKIIKIRQVSALFSVSSGYYINTPRNKRIGKNERSSTMKEITKEYSVLFNEITDVSEEILKLYTKLIEAQKRAEEIFISEDEAGEGIYIMAEMAST
jgi:hypothetical protein